MRLKHYERLKEFLDNELGDYPYFSFEIDFEEDMDGWEYYIAKVTTTDEKEGNVYFRLDKESIEVRRTEDAYEKVETFDWTVKYFWMALLSWDI